MGIDLVSVGSALRRIRQAKQLTLEDVAKLCRVDTGNLSKIENGKLGWSLPTLSDIAVKGLRTPLSEVFAEANRASGNVVEISITVPLVSLDELREGNLKTLRKNATKRVKTAANVGREAFAFAVSGNSMAPEFRTGEVVVADPDATPVFGSYVIAAVDSGVVFRHLEQDGGKSYLNSVAKGYEAIQLRPKNKIIAVARQVIRDLT